MFIANQQMLIEPWRCCDILKTNPKEIGRTYRFLKRRLMIRTPPSPLTYVSRFCSELGLNSDTEGKVREIIKLAEEKELTYGKSPTGITAAALYIAGYRMNRQNAREISEITNVTEVTIRNRYKGLLESLDFDLDI